MNNFIENWGKAAYTSLGFFWMAFWAFALGYLVSSCIQVFVTEKKIKKLMDQNESKSVLLGTFFGFISSSCSFAALATTKSLFKKGAGFIPSMAFLLSSTNLVIELGFVIFLFMGWQFVVGEYLGGVLLIIFCWIIVKIIRPKKLISEARKKLEPSNEDQKKMAEHSAMEKIRSKENWVKVGKQYVMEWKMVGKDVIIGFTVAGIIASFVPSQFFQSLFINTGSQAQEYEFYQLLEHVLVGPVMAFITFIGSMGNIPLAAVLFSNGVSFAGVMAFIFSDLVVFPVLRINAKYYGWKMSLFILFLLFASLIITSLVLHYTFNILDLLPDPSQVKIKKMDYFKADYSLILNLGFMILTGFLIGLAQLKYKKSHDMKSMANKGSNLESVLKYLMILCIIWLTGGIAIKFSGIVG